MLPQRLILNSIFVINQQYSDYKRAIKFNNAKADFNIAQLKRSFVLDTVIFTAVF